MTTFKHMHFVETIERTRDHKDLEVWNEFTVKWNLPDELHSFLEKDSTGRLKSVYEQNCARFRLEHHRLQPWVSKEGNLRDIDEFGSITSLLSESEIHQNEAIFDPTHSFELERNENF